MLSALAKTAAVVALASIALAPAVAVADDLGRQTAQGPVAVADDFGWQ
ncbi:hypothetical protein [Streptomyces galbus]|uniref:Uncharacterized protein n=1 Tax=Streptomyces galbus TaxID=33898 RepID=A0ABX1ID51_STRGB|nr:hypothetical protein [Streptomyces galbus]NKQ23593.1 hypothetical protein [Streptomyces galbus]